MGPFFVLACFSKLTDLIYKVFHPKMISVPSSGGI